MRLISQDGTTDIPYESAAVLACNDTMQIEAHVGEDIYIMAEYATEELLIFAMSEMRSAYYLHEAYKRNPQDEKLKALVSKADCREEILGGSYRFPNRMKLKSILDEYNS
jgi:hypothetical protein